MVHVSTPGPQGSQMWSEKETDRVSTDNQENGEKEGEELTQIVGKGRGGTLRGANARVVRQVPVSAVTRRGCKGGDESARPRIRTEDETYHDVTPALVQVAAHALKVVHATQAPSGGKERSALDSLPARLQVRAGLTTEVLR